MMAIALLPMIALSEVQFDYEENVDGTIALTDIMGTIPEDLVIPATYDGKKGCSTKSGTDMTDLRVGLPLDVA